ncbi:SRPBCC family protein [Neolewinella antarctica]|uniref:START domain-containing protein n=1 Tax=Neolewinella antarctica TaxID=442734 RepID=A0ABX0X6Q3_9BACT|nr:hypothetical protein [Neolewinella antarctica]NJC24558.1 hypothetical protein [Neolewinella antarctica]
MIKSCPLFLFFALSLVQSVLVGQGEWELEHAGNGVKVFVRAEANDDMSVRVETTAAVSAESVLAVLDDAPSYPAWVHRCEAAYRIPGGTDNNYLYYSHIDLPFPFQDKEVVARIDQSWSDGTLTRTILAEPDALPPNKGKDRLTTYEAEWKITPQPDGRVFITCTCRTEAGAGLPNWVRKEILTGGPAKTMENLVERLEGVARK